MVSSYQKGLSMRAHSKLTAVDLFCGAGGLAIGLERAGFHILKAVDHNDAAFATYRRNLGDHVLQGEIDENLDVPDATIIAGGPPCQGFSSAGLRRNGGQRNRPLEPR
jgi:DNA (cytosine-5)-methyltransferase 1